MKRTCIWCTVALTLALLLLGGCARQQEQLSYIGAEEAKRLALEASGLTDADVENMTADLTSYNGQDYYQIDFTAAGQSYQYDIDALTGTVIEADSPTAASESPQSTASPTPESSTDTSETSEMITVEEAKAKALAHAGLSSDQVTFVKSKLDYENARQVYDVEFYTQDYEEYDYEIDAYTGEVISFDYDAEYYTSPSSSSSTITADEAKELALAQVPGATVDDILEFEVDYDDGRTAYEGKIIYDGMKYEFEIDGYSGAIRSWEAESVGR